MKPVIKSNIENKDIVKASSSKADTFSNQLTLDQSLANPTNGKMGLDGLWNQSYQDILIIHVVIWICYLEKCLVIVEQPRTLQWVKTRLGTWLTIVYQHISKILGKKFIENSEWFVVSFDESLNSKTQECQLDVVIRFFNESQGKVEVRY